MKCKICGIRKPRRYCPGVLGDICNICCGTEREVTVDCPLDCPYLRRARIHEKYVPLDHDKTLNADIDISDSFLRDRQELIVYVGLSIKDAVTLTTGAVDRDVREALADLTRTFRTLTNGLYYDSRPANPYAAAIYIRVRQEVEEHRSAVRARGSALRDSEILKILVMYQRLGLTYDNGREKGRAFIGVLDQQFHEEQEDTDATSPLIVL